MLETIEIYLPKTKRHVKIEIYLPRKRKNIIFDSVYFLDGQNTFIDEHSTYGKSLGAKDTIEALSKKKSSLFRNRYL